MICETVPTKDLRAFCGVFADQANTDSELGAMLSYYSGRPFSRDQIPWLQVRKLDNRGIGSGILADYEHVVKFVWADTRVTIEVRDSACETVCWTDKLGSHHAALADFSITGHAPLKCLSVLLVCCPVSVRTALRRVSMLWMSGMPDSDVTIANDCICTAAGLVRASLLDSSFAGGSAAPSLLSSALLSLSVGLAIQGTAALLELDDNAASVRMQVSLVQEFGLVILSDGRTRQVELGFHDEDYDDSRVTKATCSLTTSGTKVKAHFVPEDEILPHSLAPISLLRKCSLCFRHPKCAFDFLYYLFEFVEGPEDLKHFHYIQEARNGHPIVSDFACIAQHVRARWKKVIEASIKFDSAATCLRPFLRADFGCSEVISETATALVFLETCQSREDYPPLLLVAMLQTAKRVLEILQFSEHTHQVAFPEASCIEPLAIALKAMQSLVRSWYRCCLDDLWIARASVLAIREFLAKTRLVSTLLESRTWEPVWSAVHHTRSLSGPNFVHCSCLTALRLIGMLYKGPADLLPTTWQANSSFAERWLAILRLGVTPVIAVWLSSAAGAYNVDAVSVNDTLTKYLRRYPDKALYFCDEVSLRTRIQSKVWPGSRIRRTFQYYRYHSLHEYLRKLGEALNFDLRFRGPVQFRDKRTPLEHVWTHSCWRLLHDHCDQAGTSSLTLTDTCLSIVVLSGYMHRWFLVKNRPDRLNEPEEHQFRSLWRVAAALNSFPSFTLRPMYQGTSQYRQHKRAIRDLVLEESSRRFERSVSWALCWQSGFGKSLTWNEIAAGSFRDAACCFNPLHFGQVLHGDGPIAQIASAGATFNRPVTDPWDAPTVQESEDEWSNSVEVICYRAVSTWLGARLKHTDIRLSDRNGAFSLWTEQTEATHASSHRIRGTDDEESRVHRSRSRTGWGSEQGSHTSLTSSRPLRRTFAPNRT